VASSFDNITSRARSSSDLRLYDIVGVGKDLKRGRDANGVEAVDGRVTSVPTKPSHEP
jgi:hypothetical protein